MAAVLESDDNSPAVEEREPKRPKAKRQPSKGRNKACSSLNPTAKLTYKQDKFARLVGTGISQSEAYRSAYDAEGMSDKTISEAASRLANDSTIAARITAIQAVNLRMDWQDMAQMRAKALKRLADECDGVEPDSKAATRLAAAVAIGKITEINLFTDHKVIEHRDDARLVELKSKLEQRLKALFASNDAALQRQSDEIPATDGQETPLALPKPPPEGGTPK